MSEVDHPAHYNSHPSGIECIDVVEDLPFNIGNAVKYLYRREKKGSDAIVDLEKSRWYADRELARVSVSERRSIVLNAALASRMLRVIAHEPNDHVRIAMGLLFAAAFDTMREEQQAHLSQACRAIELEVEGLSALKPRRTR